MECEEEIVENIEMGESIEIGESTISVTASLPDGKEVIQYYTPATVSGEIVKSSSATSGLALDVQETSQMTEVVDFAKSNRPYISDFEVSLNFREGFKFRIKREPTKTIKYVSGQRMGKEKS